MAIEKKQLGQLLVDIGKIDALQLEEALEYKRKKGVYLGRALVALELITEEELIEAVSEQLQLPTINPLTYKIQNESLRIVKENVAKRLNIIPLFSFDNSITIACSDPNNVEIIDELSEETVMEINLVLATETSIVKSIEMYYNAEKYKEEKTSTKDSPSKKGQVVSQEITQDTEIIEAVNMLIEEAVKAGTSDIHIEPREHDVRMRFRVDGVLQQYYTVPKSSHAAIISRLKILSDLDIAESRRPQDGRFRFNLKVGRHIDMRTSTFPTPQGEKIVMRILDEKQSNIPLTKMGFDPDILKKWHQVVHSPNGLVIVTGPTGSGKTTTLYATLNAVNSIEENIMTIEDPIEYQLGDITQGQVNTKAGVTFASALRAMLRQDPDKIMVGEMRDSETVELAIRAALTGHIVFSTLHTNDASSSYTRILNMGIDPYLISSTVRGVIAQRLLRLLCDRCKLKFEPSKNLIKSFELGDDFDGVLYKPNGCMHCKSSGYHGRGGVYELLIPTDEISDLVVNRASSRDIEKQAVKEGMITLKDAAKKYVLDGRTSIEEVMRISLA
ncbi:MAG: type II/IV secretion system protein [Candidatus Marinimicrobia bacterium]|nr:type II/IV secretion system protein [Candidatus Neomarinimicrobiota bacterium]